MWKTWEKTERNGETLTLSSAQPFRPRGFAQARRRVSKGCRKLQRAFQRAFYKVSIDRGAGRNKSNKSRKLKTNNNHH